MLLQNERLLTLLCSEVKSAWEPFAKSLQITDIDIDMYNIKTGEFYILTSDWTFTHFFSKQNLFPTQEEIILVLSGSPLFFTSPLIEGDIGAYNKNKYDAMKRLTIELGCGHRLHYGFMQDSQWCRVYTLSVGDPSPQGLQTLMNQSFTIQNIVNLFDNQIKKIEQKIKNTFATLPEFDEHYYELAKAILSEDLQPNKIHALFKDAFKISTREMQCLILTAEGLSAKQIAQRLQISPRTVEDHLEKVKQKLDIPNKSGLIKKYLSLNAFNLY